MRFCIKKDFFKINLKFILLFTISVFLSACESIPSNSSKPVFKIANFPSVEQKKENTNDSDQKVNQSKTEKETDLVDTNALAKATQPAKITLDVVREKERENNVQKNPGEMVDQNAFTSLPDLKETKIQDNKSLDTNDLAFTKDNFENKKTKTNRENLDKKILELKTYQENKIASLTTLPQVPIKPPPIKKIKINSLINVKVENLEGVLGKPNFIIVNEGMNLWQYEFGKCIIDFFLKFNESNYFVVFIDIRASELGYSTDMTTCENELSNALNH